MAGYPGGAAGVGDGKGSGKKDEDPSRYYVEEIDWGYDPEENWKPTPPGASGNCYYNPLTDTWTYPEPYVPEPEPLPFAGWVPGPAWPRDPATGWYTNPSDGTQLDVTNGSRRDPATGWWQEPVLLRWRNPVTEEVWDPITGLFIHPVTGQYARTSWFGQADTEGA
jgi:hypothetical protein